MANWITGTINEIDSTPSLSSTSSSMYGRSECKLNVHTLDTLLGSIHHDTANRNIEQFLAAVNWMGTYTHTRTQCLCSQWEYCCQNLACPNRKNQYLLLISKVNLGTSRLRVNKDGGCRHCWQAEQFFFVFFSRVDKRRKARHKWILKMHPGFMVKGVWHTCSTIS